MPTTPELVRLDGRVAVVTGANTGIGRSVAEGLARLGATTVLACRNSAAAEAARRDIARTTGNDDLHVVELDLADAESVDSAASTIVARWPALHVLVNNAGAVHGERNESAQGFERTFAVNHLGPYQLTRRVLDAMQAGGGEGRSSRIVNVASAAHRGARLRFDDLMATETYKASRAYAQSKLANVLFTRSLASRLDAEVVTANACHPGVVRTRFGRDGDVPGWRSAALVFARLFMVSPERGAATPLFLAAAPEVEGVSGAYFARNRLAAPSWPARDDEAAERLWQVSAELLADAGITLGE